MIIYNSFRHVCIFSQVNSYLLWFFFQMAAKLVGMQQSLVSIIFHYRPQRSCGQGYVFTRVCDSVNRGACLRQTSPSWEQTPRSRQPPPPGLDTPPRSTPREQTPQSRPPRPQVRHPSPLEQTPPRSRLRHTVNERPVRILLECILVLTSTFIVISNELVFHGKKIIPFGFLPKMVSEYFCDSLKL